MPSPRSRSRRNIRAIGEARQSQVLQLYGPGAMVDLPGYAVVIGGLDYWNTKGSVPVDEPRLLQLVRLLALQWLHRLCLRCRCGQSIARRRRCRHRPR